MKTKYFDTEPKLTLWVNNNIRVGDVISIVKDVTNGKWVLFYAI